MGAWQIFLESQPDSKPFFGGEGGRVGWGGMWSGKGSKGWRCISYTLKY